MDISYDMTVSDFIKVVKDKHLSNENIRIMLGQLGETISKNSISNIYIVAGFEIKDNRKKIIEPTEKVNYEMTLKEAIPLARSLRMHNEKNTKNTNSEVVKKEKKPSPIVIDKPKEQLENEFTGRIQSNLFPIDPGAEAKDFILKALGLTNDELESIKNLIYSKNEFNSNSFESIYEAIKQLGGRERINKTYYISKEIIDRVAEFAEVKSVKVSQFVEVALLDAIKKYQ